MKNLQKLRLKVGWFNKVNENTILECVEQASKYTLKDFIKQNKSREIVLWRSAAQCCFLLNGKNRMEVGAIFKRSHSSVTYSLMCACNDIDVNNKDSIVERVELIFSLVKSKKRMCNLTEFKIKKNANKQRKKKFTF